MTSPKRWILSFIFTVLCLKKSLLIRIIISISIIVRFNPAFRSSSLLLSLFFFSFINDASTSASTRKGKKYDRCACACAQKLHALLSDKMPFSSIGNGGIGTKCAENPTRKKCAKIPRSNISGMCGMSGISGMPRSNAKVKCQGQMPRSNGKPEKTGKMGKCNKNEKTKKA